VISQWKRWAALLAVSLPLTAVLVRLHLPAALLLGPMLCGMAFGVGGSGLRLPRPAFSAAQSVIGCLVAGSLTPAIFTSMSHAWLAVLVSVALTVVAGALVGLVMVRYGSLPGMTAAWGSSPGAASVMVALADEFGADMKLVAFMQYLRVIMVVISASTVSRFLLGAAPAAAAVRGDDLFSGAATDFAATLALAGVAGWLGRRSRLPGGTLLLPMIAGALLQAGGALVISLPSWLLGAVYAFLGLYVGLGFDRRAFLHALRAVPQIVAAALLLIALCAGTAWLLTFLLPIDGLSAFLATSPGGLDTIAIITVSSHADLSLVMAVQTLRFFAVIVTGPAIARWITRHACQTP
jgi:membrane AbrB-like protein